MAPGRGKIYVRSDSKAFRLFSGKVEAHFLAKKNPRHFHWTVFFRKVNKKNTSEEVAKKRTRYVVKIQRTISGITWEQLQAKQNQSEAVRDKIREEAILAAKEKAKQEQDAKRKAAAKNLSAADAKAIKAQQMKATSRNVKAPSRGQPTSR